MEWTKEKPKVAGLYVRTTLWGKKVVHKVWERAGLPEDGLVTVHGDSVVAISRLDPKFFWFGPIPEPPPEADWVSAQKSRR